MPILYEQSVFDTTIIKQLAPRIWPNNENYFFCAWGSAQWQKKSLPTKALKGRGRKCVAWVTELKPDSLVEFERLKKMRMKFVVPALVLFPNHLIKQSTDSAYYKTMRSGKNATLLRELISTKRGEKIYVLKDYFRQTTSWKVLGCTRSADQNQEGIGLLS